MNNPYCEALGVAVPRLEAAKDSPEANCFALLIVALLEHGAPMTLAQLDELLRDPGIGHWSAQRVAICVLDAHRDRMAPRSVVGSVEPRTRH